MVVCVYILYDILVIWPWLGLSSYRKTGLRRERSLRDPLRGFLMLKKSGRGALWYRVSHNQNPLKYVSRTDVCALLYRSLGGEVSHDGDFMIFEANRYSRKGFLFKSFAMSAVVRTLTLILVLGVCPIVPYWFTGSTRVSLCIDHRRGQTHSVRAGEVRGPARGDWPWSSHRDNR